MLIQPRPLVPFTFERRVFRQYLLKVEFSTDAAAPITSPYVGEVGSLTITDTSNTYSVSAGELIFTGPSSSANFDNPRIVCAALTRLTGLALKTHLNIASGAAQTLPGWRNSASGNSTSVLYGWYISNSGTVLNAYSGAGTLVSVGALTLAADYEAAFVLRSTGCFLFIKGGSQFPAWTLAWVFDHATTASLFPSLQSVNSGAVQQDFIRAVPLLAPFNSDYAIAIVHTSAVSGSDYAASANGIFDLLITAPAALAGAAGLKFRKNGGDYWQVNFDNTGALIVQRYASDVAQGSPVTLATAVITGSATRTIRVVAVGASMDFYTLSGSTWTKRGSTQTDSNLTANTGISPFADSSWTGGGGALGQIDAWARTSSYYDTLDNI